MGVLLYDSDMRSENTPRVRRLLRNFSIFPFGLTNLESSPLNSAFIFIFTVSFENLIVELYVFIIYFILVNF